MSSMYGSHYIPGRAWRPFVEVSLDNVGQVPPGAFETDPFLPALAIDPFDPVAAVVIPLGRFVGIGYSSGRSGTNFRMLRGDTGKTPITIADGKNVTPAGMSINQMYRTTSEFMVDSNTVKFRKGFVAEVPFVPSINDAYGSIRSGDYLTPYFGSTTVTAPSNIHKGKPVRWIPKQVYSQTGSASATWDLTATLNRPGIEPRVIMVTALGVPLTAASTSVAWNDATDMWRVSVTGTGSATTTHVVYEFGQDADQIAGSAIRVQGLADIIENDQFLRWVEYGPKDPLNFPPAAQRFPVTQVVSGTPTHVAGLRFSMGQSFISIHHPVVLRIRNVSVTDAAGVTTNYTSEWYTLPTNATLSARAYFIGAFHYLNWRTGELELTSNIAPVTGTAANIQISADFSYQTDPRDGAALWGGGIIGLTDGREITLGQNSTDGMGVSQNLTPTSAAGGYGTPAHLNLSDVVGALRLFVN